MGRRSDSTSFFSLTISFIRILSIYYYCIQSIRCLLHTYIVYSILSHESLLMASTSNALRRAVALRRSSGTLLHVSTRSSGTYGVAAKAAADTPDTPAVASPARENERRSSSSSSSSSSSLPRFQFTDGHGLHDVLRSTTLELSRDEARHAVKALRLRVGSRLEVVDGRGNLVRCEIVETRRRGSLVVRAIEDVEHVEWNGLAVDAVVACSTLKGGRADYMIEKLTELGARSFTPLLCARSDAAGEGGGGGGGRNARWMRVQQAAQKQCLRLHSLEMRPPIHVHDFCQKYAASRAGDDDAGTSMPHTILVAQQGAKHSLSSFIASGRMKPASSKTKADTHRSRISVVIGPEGDFTPDERCALQEIGGNVFEVSLGRQRLRCETAAIAIVSALQLMLDDE